ncbi:hypothetical protein [Umezakia ovalisporum]|uniref:Uncharacterized protein n=1 Tax=Umezakia ovalisporum FSS-62 TaxID=2971776 RepID=A0AA43GXQ0_9CYAN|nr:hypothetical protein [Umezakia ovalisporum]MDH6062763.1 hypothetical protein [Umezakia ovalisporum FSS-62]
MFFLSNTLKSLLYHPLSSSKPWKALRNLVHWQLHSRLVNQSLSAFVFRFVENTNIITRGGETGATGNIYFGLHEFVDMCLILHFLSKDDLFFEEITTPKQQSVFKRLGLLARKFIGY